MHKLFPSQQENEQIYLVVREHWFFLLLKLAVVAILLAALLLFNHYGPILAPGLFEAPNIFITNIATETYILFLLVSLLLIWVLYYLNIQIITNVRIVDINQEGLFNRTISELHINQIEDVTSESKGVFATIFNYGHVFVQTAGTKERFDFQNVGSPDKIEKLVLTLYEKLPHNGPE